MISLTDEEIKELMIKSDAVYELPGFAVTASDTSKWAGRLLAYALKAQLKKVYEWGNETCDNDDHWQHKFGDINVRLHPLYRRNCGLCWQELLKEIEG